MYSFQMGTLKMCIFGNPGVGKTHLIGTIIDVPEMLPALLIAVETNLDPIADSLNPMSAEQFLKSKDMPLSKDKIDTIVLPTIPDVEKICNKIFDTPYENNYKTVIVDSWSSLDNVALNWVLGKEFVDLRVVTPEFKHFRRQGILLENIIFNMVNVYSGNFIITAHNSIPDKEDIDKTIRPSLTGKMAIRIPGVLKSTGYYDFVNAGTPNAKRVLTFTPVGMVFGKNCSKGNSLALSPFTNPTFADIYKRLKSESQS